MNLLFAKEVDTMSASAQNCVYEIRVTKGKEKPIPTVSKEKMEEYRKNVEKYLPLKNVK